MGGDHRIHDGGGGSVSFLRENWRALLLLTLGALFVILGLGRGEGEIVFRKAVNICLECIGLG